MADLSVLLAGDHFVRPTELRAALHDAIGDDLRCSELTLPWPHEPYGDVDEVHEATGDPAELAEAVTGHTVAVTQLGAFTRSVLEAADELRLVAVTRGGPVNVNLEAATERGILVAYAPGRNAVAAAEYAVGMLLATLRRIPAIDRTFKEGAWRGDFYDYDACGNEIEGAVAGLVGYGAIGSRVARVLIALGAEVLVADPYVDAEQVSADGARVVELDELLERSRVLSLHARLSEETEHMIGADELARLPAGAVVVNTARGGLLDYEALCDALERGHLAGAALDVYDDEPPPRDSRLRTLPGLVCTPHLAGATRQTAQRAARIAAGEVARFARGEEPANLANPEVLERCRSAG